MLILKMAENSLTDYTSGPATVLIAVDGKGHSDRAFTFYAKYMHKPGNYVIVAHGMNLPAMPTRDDWDETHEVARKDVKIKEIEDKYLGLMAELQIEGKFVPGLEKPGEFIIDTATKYNATMIVMGTRQLGKVKRTLMGSVSDHVVHNAKCAVMVVRQ